jgi:hypothetical protein
MNVCVCVRARAYVASECTHAVTISVGTLYVHMYSYVGRHGGMDVYTGL